MSAKIGYSELTSSFDSNGNELKRRNRVSSVVGGGKNRTLLFFRKVDLTTNNPQVFSHSAIGQSSYKTTKRKKSAFSPFVNTTRCAVYQKKPELPFPSHAV